MLSAALGAVAPVCSERLRRRDFFDFFSTVPSSLKLAGGSTVPAIVLRARKRHAVLLDGKGEHAWRDAAATDEKTN